MAEQDNVPSFPAHKGLGFMHYAHMLQDFKAWIEFEMSDQRGWPIKQVEVLGKDFFLVFSEEFILGKVLYYAQGDEVSSFPHHRACILWDTTRPVSKSVKIMLRDGMSIWQAITFRNIPCNKKGHLARACNSEKSDAPETVIDQPATSVENPAPSLGIGTRNEDNEFAEDVRVNYQRAPADSHHHGEDEDDQEEDVEDELDLPAPGSQDVDLPDLEQDNLEAGEEEIAEALQQVDTLIE
ncbi:unnamed protein product [Calypogeia fissa]